MDTWTYRHIDGPASGDANRGAAQLHATQLMVHSWHLVIDVGLELY